MNLQLSARSPYVLLPSGVLIVEPHEGLLAARSLLLATADYYVGVSGSTGIGAPQGRCDGYEVAVAILSESLGGGLLTATAQDVRQAWPNARILIFGRRGAAIEDNLYDARIDHRARPEDLLSMLDVLTRDHWNRRARPAGTIADVGYHALSLTSGPSGICAIAESDPTKRLVNAVNLAHQRELPGDQQSFKKAS